MRYHPEEGTDIGNKVRKPFRCNIEFNKELHKIIKLLNLNSSDRVLG
jgi:hypothetical protein